MAASLFALNVVDYFLTMWILRLGGIEINPIMAPIISTPLAPSLKIVAVGAACVALALRARTRLVVGALALTVAYYLMVVGWNTASLYLFYS